jgi:hypothetical protein
MNRKRITVRVNVTRSISLSPEEFRRWGHQVIEPRSFGNRALRKSDVSFGSNCACAGRSGMFDLAYTCAPQREPRVDTPLSKRSYAG